MKKYYILILFALLVVAAIPAIARAESLDHPIDPYEPTVCSVPTYEWLVYGELPGTVAVYDFEHILDNRPLVNAGSTVMGTPCYPITCPDGMFLVSGNGCAFNDPFDHIPYEDDVEVELLSRASATESPTYVTFYYGTHAI